jgi:hypothetical protein
MTLAEALAGGAQDPAALGRRKAPLGLAPDASSRTARRRRLTAASAHFARLANWRGRSSRRVSGDRGPHPGAHRRSRRVARGLGVDFTSACEAPRAELGAAVEPGAAASLRRTSCSPRSCQRGIPGSAAEFETLRVPWAGQAAVRRSRASGRITARIDRVKDEGRGGDER